uniref:CCR4-NOT transcription complex subunit 9 n=1 Tax=Meleagris gallopavo TaxID=9103 RepID=G3UTG3_MELGA
MKISTLLPSAAAPAPGNDASASTKSWLTGSGAAPSVAVGLPTAPAAPTAPGEGRSSSEHRASIFLARSRRCSHFCAHCPFSQRPGHGGFLEIVNIYPSINPPTLTAHQSNRVCNALALLQCVASHPETRSAFLAAHIPLFLYPFLHTVSKTRPFEYLRLTSLGVIGALVKTDEQEVINFLLTTEIIPLCLRIMESGSELSKTVATFILQKILLDDTGLAYICQTYERFSHVAMILGKMVLQLSKEPSARLLKHVVRCYLRLSDNPRAREALRQCLPDQLKDTTFAQVLKDDTTTKRWLAQLVKNLQEGQVTDPRGIPLPPQ